MLPEQHRAGAAADRKEALALTKPGSADDKRRVFVLTKTAPTACTKAEPALQDDSLCEVTSLQHELRDDTVEDGALVAQRLARLAVALLASAQSPEVLNSLGDDITKQAHHDATYDSIDTVWLSHSC